MDTNRIRRGKGYFWIWIVAIVFVAAATVEVAESAPARPPRRKGPAGRARGPKPTHKPKGPKGTPKPKAPKSPLKPRRPRLPKAPQRYLPPRWRYRHPVIYRRTYVPLVVYGGTRVIVTPPEETIVQPETYVQPSETAQPPPGTHSTTIIRDQRAAEPSPFVQFGQIVDQRKREIEAYNQNAAKSGKGITLSHDGRYYKAYYRVTLAGVGIEVTSERPLRLTGTISLEHVLHQQGGKTKEELLKTRGKPDKNVEPTYAEETYSYQGGRWVYVEPSGEEGEEDAGEK